ncbi:accessory Sec system translocase SecA2 [Arthrobacter sp. GMC3]|uniref:accessory Sec system translocase SecA2 n=1 Tax=Arthrobacter sp. GMC3 TaxID=2058894 RepID=UPI000CE4914E|nr:accessory Sec system translocase SecA2 [Arthrobacter sp. GMC3]
MRNDKERGAGSRTKTGGKSRLGGTFRNWLFNTAGVADTEDLGQLADSAAARADAADQDASTTVPELLTGLRATPENGKNPIWTDQQLEDYLFCARILVAESMDVTLFDTQLLAAANMIRGTVVEMDTGEGKTFVGAVVAGAHALNGRRVHVLTVNDYLAQRDAEWMRPFYDSLSVTVSSVSAAVSRQERQQAYQSDVVYVSVNELGFDVLRDRTATAPAQLMLQPFDVCIVDEIDSVLVDEATVPLVLAGRARAELQSVDVADFVSGLNPDTDYTVEADRRNVSLTDAGIDRAEARWPDVELYSAAGTPLFSSINVALHAQVLLQRDVDYIVRDGQAQIVSDSRGRVASMQRWPDGLQAAVETKEGLVKTEQGEVLDQLLVKDLIKSFANVTGMSGTAVAVAEYLRTNYLLDAGRIPSHKASIRGDRPEQIYATGTQRDAAVVAAAMEAHATGQPVLIGTHDVGTSERFAALLTGNGVTCQVLNARNDSLEAQIIAQAGRLNAVTVSTQMAGRGTDIVLGGADPHRENAEAEHAAVAALGGLLVIIVGRFYSRRLDAQLRGRAGRQGDPGASIIFSSMDDPAANGQETHGLELSDSVSGATDDDGLVTKVGVSTLLDRAQRLSEQERFTTQENSWKYNELIAYQRQVVLTERSKALLEDAAALEPYEFGDAGRLAELRRVLAGQDLIEVCRAILLFEMDAHWSDHLALLSEQRAAIHLRALGRQNPLDEYRRETIFAFDGFLNRVHDSARATLQSLPVKDGAVDLEAAGIRRASSTWTYVVNEDPFGSQSDQIVKWLLKKMGK